MCALTGRDEEVDDLDGIGISNHHIGHYYQYYVSFSSVVASNVSAMGRPTFYVPVNDSCVISMHEAETKQTSALLI